MSAVKKKQRRQKFENKYVFKPEKLLTLKFNFSHDDIKKNNSANIKDGSNEGGKDENVIQLYKHMKLKALIGKPVSDYSLSVAAFWNKSKKINFLLMVKL